MSAKLNDISKNANEVTPKRYRKYLLVAFNWGGCKGSYRFRHSSATAKSRIKAREQSKHPEKTEEKDPF